MEKQDFIIIPKKSIGPIKIGMMKSEVDDILPAPSANRNTMFYYFQNLLHVEIKNDIVVFIQLCSNQDILPIFENKNLFSLKDKEILSLFSKYDSVDEDDAEYGYVYQFNKIGINFGREAIPEDLEQELENLDKNSKDFQEEKDFYVTEIEKYRYFQTVAVFGEGYYS